MGWDGTRWEKVSGILDLMNVQWTTQTILPLRPSTVLSLETSATSQIKVALTRSGAQKRAVPMFKWSRRGNPRAWNPKAPRLSSSEGARGVTERGLGECMFDNTVAQN